MNGDETVHPVIRDAVQTAIQELGYRPSPIARNLRRGTSGILGFVLSDLANPTYGAMVPIVQELTREAGYAVIVMDSGMDPGLEAKNLELLYSLRVDGFVWNPLLPTAEQLPWKPGEVPLLSLPKVPEWDGPGVIVDTTPATLEALDDFLRLGHKRVGITTIHGLGGTQRGLLAAMRRRVAEAGAQLVSDSSWTFYSLEESVSVLVEKLRSPDRPTALLAASAVLPHLLVATRTLGLKIPRDISVVSIASSELAEVYDPPINVISFDYREFATEAVAKLLDLIRDVAPTAPAEVHKAEYIVRRSVARAPADPGLAHGKRPGATET
jgi:LacI family transcriptional regulator